MQAIIGNGNKKYAADLLRPLDISIPLRSGAHNPNAFGIGQPVFEPFRAGGFVGSVALGGSVNCENLLLNPHGNGTHTECVGHISRERITINQCLKQFWSFAQLITVEPRRQGNDSLVTLQDVQGLYQGGTEALIIRTSPNTAEKLEKIYSSNNPAYLEAALCEWLREQGVKHLLIDLPSVDAEEDGGALAAHHAFWNYPAAARLDATISEMVFVPDEIRDGVYLLNLQIASIESDASPSKPVLYALEQA
jgi:kynurenine formamidase